MRDNIEQVKETVRNSTDLKYQVRQRPWVMFGLSVMLGSLVGRLILGNSQSSGARYQSAVDDTDGNRSESTRTRVQNLAANMNLDDYAKHLSVIKNASMGALTSIFVELSRHVVPAIVTQIENFAKNWGVNSTTDKNRQAGEQNNHFRTSIQ